MDLDGIHNGTDPHFPIMFPSFLPWFSKKKHDLSMGDLQDPIVWRYLYSIYKAYIFLGLCFSEYHHWPIFGAGTASPWRPGPWRAYAILGVHPTLKTSWELKVFLEKVRPIEGIIGLAMVYGRYIYMYIYI